jgi:branched-chain amino acid aminotransferase
MAANSVFINTTFVPADQAAILITDLSVQRGYGIFDFFKTIGGKPIFLKDHLERFYQSASNMHLNVSHSAAELEHIIRELQQRNNLPDSGIRLTLTGGYSADGYTLAEKPNLIITQLPLSPPLTFQPAGINLVSYNYQRQLAASKTLDYAMAIWLQPFIKENQANDVLYHHEGMVKEAPRANFFIVTKDQEVVTAKTNVLKGVIRKNLLALENSGITVVERDFSLEEVTHAAEAFITSTTKNVLPVVQLNGKPIGTGKAGPLSAKLFELLIETINQD